MKQFPVLAFALVLAVACASSPAPTETAPQTGYSQDQSIPATSPEGAAPVLVAAEEGIAEPTPVCKPEVVDDRAKLNPNCITVLEDLAKRNGRYAATTRHKRELRSLCENQWLPRCRHKY
ncbi:MAG: hypothetical protein AAGA23_23160 [Pseudomonadota bacterium]